MDASALGGPSADISFLSLFLQADLVVKSVMLILLLASLWVWGVVIDKAWRLRAIRRRTDKFEEMLHSNMGMNYLFQSLGSQPDNPMALMFVRAMEEWQDGPRAKDAQGYDGVLARTKDILALWRQREIARLEDSLGFLATTGAVAPFIGLFGTVWGIMRSFQAIAATKNTTLAVVAPGIAEALLATAMGLIAAIPAVIFYNKLTNDIDRYNDRLERFADEFGIVLSRDFDGQRTA